VFEFVVAVSLGVVELCSSQGSSVCVFNEHDILTYEWVKAAYSCTHSETCTCVEVRELKVSKLQLQFSVVGEQNQNYRGTANKIRSNNGNSTVSSMSNMRSDPL